MSSLSKKTTLRRALIVSAFTYTFVSAPVMLIFLKSEHVRFVNYNTLGHWMGRVRGLETVFVGDSITAGGRAWGLRISGHPFNSINLAGNGYTVSQIRDQVSRAYDYSPKRIFVLAGTNDILRSRGNFDLKAFGTEYERLIQEATRGGAELIVTLIPFTADPAHSALIAKANDLIMKLCARFSIRVIDLNKTLAPDSVLLDRYSVDGVHLKEDAYAVWIEAISKL